MSIKPIGKRILIKPIKTEEMTAGGIYLPDSAKEKKKQGIVVEIGDFKDESKLPIKKGDIVLYTGYASEEIEVGGEVYIILNCKDVIAKIVK